MFTFITLLNYEMNVRKASLPDEEVPKPEDEYIEDIVCCESEIHENEMKVFDLKDAGKVLLVRQRGKIHALGTKCTHYGAPLVNGALGDGRVRCQWHGACFNIETGDIEDFPGLDSLPCHQVTIEDCKVKVRAKRSALENPKRVKPMCKRLNDDEHYVVIGGGPAGAVCVETLRQENFTGSITLIARENHLPYDRVKVSKIGDFDIEQNQFRTPEFYKEHDIDVRLGISAKKVDVEEKKVILDSGEKISFDKLFIATGSKAAVINVPGKDLKNIITLRDYEDGKNLLSLLTPETNLVINGSSFIAMEAAAMCADKVKNITVVSRSKAPFKHALGEEVGYAFMKLFKAKGINFRTNTNIKTIKDDGTGKVGAVELEDGLTLDSSVVLLGVGSTVYTEFLKDSGISLRSDGSVDVNGYLQSNIEGIFAGGDIAYAPVFSHDNKKATIGHFPLAHYHGRIAALNMLGRKQELKVVPYFWTSLFGKSIRYAGSGSFEDVIYVGNIDDLKFVAFYINKADQVVAASSCGMDPIVSQFAELLHQGKKLYRKDIDKQPLGWLSSITPDPVVPLDQRIN
ncbi:apoptosis-inducing factor 3-like isoform X2 [Coccinella septempunctata]|uniref:apoptosis-inducing factor 3-like isoform X2 n=1 Tax=Coccinella septempunctata TaxID=41139 RepID=UPI001D0845BF|nr:apoptosis-inducing factor 3-like isoform X2 [Coccinella septempunctata]